MVTAERKALGARLRILRREVHHASQEEMRDRTGLAVATISRIEHGDASVSPRSLATYSAALAVPDEDDLTPASAPRTIDVSGLTPVQITLLEHLVVELRAAG